MRKIKRMLNRLSDMEASACGHEILCERAASYRSEMESYIQSELAERDERIQQLLSKP